MRTNILKADAMLLLTAALWGAAFVAQRLGMNQVGPLTFNGVRFALGALSLFPLMRYVRRSRQVPEGVDDSLQAYLRAGCAAGLLLFAGATLQQVGLKYTTAGKAGFITGLYVVIVPLLGLFWKQIPDAGTVLGAGIAAAGLYFLSVTEAFTIEWGDFLELIGAFFWAGHVLLVGKFARTLEPVSFSCAQFGVCAMFSLLVALGTETITASGLWGAAIPIAYGGFISVGIGYTLQVVAQKDAPPAHAAILLSLESVFAALAGWAILTETMNSRGILGCALMLIGCLLAQLWPTKSS